MATVRVNNQENAPVFVGAETDDAPTAQPAGCRFFEQDTGILYLSDADSAWHRINSGFDSLYRGISFTCSLVELMLGLDATITLSFKTPPGPKRVRFVMTFSAAGNAHLDLVEGPTWTQGSGAAQPILNSKREITANDSMLLEDQVQPEFTESNIMVANAADLSGGATIAESYAFGFKSAEPGMERLERLLKTDSTYAVILTSLVGGNSGQISLEWSEQILTRN